MVFAGHLLCSVSLPLRYLGGICFVLVAMSWLFDELFRQKYYFPVHTLLAYDFGIASLPKILKLKRTETQIKIIFMLNDKGSLSYTDLMDLFFTSLFSES